MLFLWNSLFFLWNWNLFGWQFSEIEVPETYILTASELNTSFYMSSIFFYRKPITFAKFMIAWLTLMIFNASFQIIIFLYEEAGTISSNAKHTWLYGYIFVFEVIFFEVRIAGDFCINSHSMLPTCMLYYSLTFNLLVYNLNLITRENI